MAAAIPVALLLWYAGALLYAHRRLSRTVRDSVELLRGFIRGEEV